MKNGQHVHSTPSAPPEPHLARPAKAFDHPSRPEVRSRETKRHWATSSTSRTSSWRGSCTVTPPRRPEPTRTSSTRSGGSGCVPRPTSRLSSGVLAWVFDQVVDRDGRCTAPRTRERRCGHVSQALRVAVLSRHALIRAGLIQLLSYDNDRASVVGEPDPGRRRLGATTCRLRPDGSHRLRPDRPGHPPRRRYPGGGTDPSHAQGPGRGRLGDGGHRDVCSWTSTAARPPPDTRAGRGRPPPRRRPTAVVPRRCPGPLPPDGSRNTDPRAHRERPAPTRTSPSGST